jgi:exodeoxyribonuclease VIII
MAERHVMIDLETLGRRPGCAIASIGAMDFDPLNVRFSAPSFYCVIDWPACGLEIERETFAWWLAQSKDACAELMNTADAIPLIHALSNLSGYLGEGADDDLVLWCQGASFDFGILGAAYDHCGMARPWRYWQERCARTIRKVAGVPEPERAEADKHHALRDAAHQVRCVQAALKALRGRSV